MDCNYYERLRLKVKKLTFNFSLWIKKNVKRIKSENVEKSYVKIRKIVAYAILLGSQSKLWGLIIWYHQWLHPRPLTIDINFGKIE